MAFPREILVSGIRIANSLTAGVQPFIWHSTCVDEDGEGHRTYAAPIRRSCVVDLTRKIIPGPSGKDQTIIATLTFVGDVPPNGTITPWGRIEPFDLRDVITLPDGTTGPIVSNPGAVVDPVTGRGFIHVITLGAL
jgi:hypothetical protein